MQNEKGNKHILEESTCERDLGIFVDNRLRWQAQINHAKAKAYASLGNLKRSFTHWTPFTFKTLYSAFVRPHLELCSSVWSPTTRADIESLESVQKNATKLVPSLRSLNYEKRLSSLGLTTLEVRRARGDLIHYYKFLKGINTISWVRPNLPAPSSMLDGPAGSVRGNSDRLVSQRTKSKPRANFFSNRVIPLWNRLPSVVTNAPTINSFKNRIDKIDLEALLSNASQRNF